MLILLIFNIFAISLIFPKNVVVNNNKSTKTKIKYKTINGHVKNSIYNLKSNNHNIFSEKCYLSPEKPEIKIIHFIITRFMMELVKIKVDIPKSDIYKDEYILNGFRVMKKYLIPSLEKQSCKNFIWILMVGNKVNVTYLDSLINVKNNSFETIFIYKKKLKNYIRNKVKGYDILITTRIDYDDRIYYDAVNDVRKVININKPILLYGYNRGVHYYENEDNYYDFYKNYKNKGVMSIFISLIIVLKKVNDIYTIYDLGGHTLIRTTLLKSYKSFGIKFLNYEPAIFDSGVPKFVWVRHNFSGTLNYSKFVKKNLKLTHFNLNNFYGK